MSKRQFQVSMQTMLAVMTILIAYWQLPGGMELLITLAAALLVGVFVLAALIVIQWPIFLIIHQDGTPIPTVRRARLLRRRIVRAVRVSLRD